MKKWTLILIMGLLVFSGCSGSTKLNPKEPTTLTFWHVYGSQTDSPMNLKVEEFNRTVGKEKGIIINVTSVSNSSAIHDALIQSANREPGTPELPDLFTAYPKTAVAMGEEKLLDFSSIFSNNEIAEFVPEFIAEGTINGKLLVFPIAKSTELNFINKTIFDRFSAAAGVTEQDLMTWEGLIDAADKYAKWSGGKTFFMNDSPFNCFQLGIAGLGGQFIKDEQLQLDGAAFQKMWDAYALSAIKGTFALQEGYGTAPMMTGDIAANIGSSASILYFKDEVTYADNTKEPLNLMTLPVPVFQDGKRLAVQRGVGLCAVNTTPEKAEAAKLFIKWFTETQTNLDFVTQTGYLPTKTEHYRMLFDGYSIDDPKYRQLYESVSTLYREYEFYTPPLFESYGALEKKFDKTLKQVLLEAREAYIAGGDINTLSDQALMKLKNQF